VTTPTRRATRSGSSLSRDHDVGEPAHQRGAVQRHEHRHPGRGEREHRRHERPEGGGDQEDHGGEGRGLDTREGLLQDPPLLGARRDRAGHPDEVVLLRVVVPVGEALRRRVLVVEADLRRHEQQRQDRGVPLLRAREEPERVGHGDRAQDGCGVLVLAAGQRRGAQHGVDLGVRREAVGVALHDHGAADEREAEDLQRAQLGGDGW